MRQLKFRMARLLLTFPANFASNAFLMAMYLGWYPHPPQYVMFTLTDLAVAKKRAPICLSIARTKEACDVVARGEFKMGGEILVQSTTSSYHHRDIIVADCGSTRWASSSERHPVGLRLLLWQMWLCYSYHCDVTVVKGPRNSHDFSYPNFGNLQQNSWNLLQKLPESRSNKSFKKTWKQNCSVPRNQFKNSCITGSMMVMP